MENKERFLTWKFKTRDNYKAVLMHPIPKSPIQVNLPYSQAQPHINVDQSVMITFKKKDKVNPHLSLYGVRYPNFSYIGSVRDYPKESFGNIKEIRRIYLKEDPISFEVRQNNDMMIASENLLSYISTTSVNTLELPATFKRFKFHPMDHTVGAGVPKDGDVFVWVSCQTSQSISILNTKSPIFDFSIDPLESDQALIITKDSIFHFDPRQESNFRSLSDDSTLHPNSVCVEYSPSIPCTLR